MRLLIMQVIDHVIRSFASNSVLLPSNTNNSAASSVSTMPAQPLSICAPDTQAQAIVPLGSQHEPNPPCVSEQNTRTSKKRARECDQSERDSEANLEEDKKQE